jgi:hypothetical protein
MSFHISEESYHTYPHNEEERKTWDENGVSGIREI